MEETSSGGQGPLERRPEPRITYSGVEMCYGGRKARLTTYDRVSLYTLRKDTTEDAIIILVTDPEDDVVNPPENDWKTVAEGGRFYHFREVSNGADATRVLAEYWGCESSEIDYPAPSEITKDQWFGFALFHNGELVTDPDDWLRSIYQIEMEMDDKGFLKPGLRELSGDVRWRCSSYQYAREAARQCVEKGLASGWRVEGRSGVPSRNWIVLEGVKTRQRQALSAKLQILYDWDRRILSCSSKAVEVEFADPAIQSQCLAVRSELKTKEAEEEWAKLIGEETDVAEVREFNKTLASTVDKPPEGYDIVFRRTTSRGNTTAILVRVAERIRCPQALKGSVIGKEGKRIKDLQTRHSIKRIQVV